MIKVDEQRSSVKVSGKYLTAEKAVERRNLSFVRIVVGVPDAAARVSGLTITDQNGGSIPYKKFGTGEYVAEADFGRWDYEIDIAPQKDPRSTAHISWVSDKCGILMLDDLLPQSSKSAGNSTVRIMVPEGWKIVSTEKRVDPDTFEVRNIQKAIFLIGRDLRETKVSAGISFLNVVTSGDWLFSDAESGRSVEEISKEYSELFGSSLTGNSQIAIFPFPQKEIQKGTWEAETRGGSVLIVSADMPFKTQSLQRLQEQLRHEIFHLWLPNGVNLSGNYDWFYEGFALYQSLKAGVALNQIRFEDFLETLSRAHNIDSMQTRRLSLIDASKERWNGADTQVYARGMLAAFLCDLSLLQSSKGKKSVGDLFRDLFNSHRPPKPVSEANATIVELFANYPPLTTIVETYIKGSETIDWQVQLGAAGIESEPGNTQANLRVKAKLNGGQKALLDKLGYNNWRKLARK